MSLGDAMQGGRAQVMFLDNNSGTGLHKARTHGPRWRRAHARSMDERSFSITPRQLPPCLARVLLVHSWNS